MPGEAGRYVTPQAGAAAAGASPEVRPTGPHGVYRAPLQLGGADVRLSACLRTTCGRLGRGSVL